MVLCFAFVAEPVLIVGQYLATAGELNVRAFFSLFSANRNRLDVRSGWDRAQSGQLAQTEQRGIPYHNAQAIKVKKVGYWWLRCLSFYFVCWGAALLEVGKHLPASGKQWINSSVWLFLHARLSASLSNCHYFDWWVFLFSFYFSPGEGDMREKKNDWLPSGLNPLPYLR